MLFHGHRSSSLTIFWFFMQIPPWPPQLYIVELLLYTWWCCRITYRREPEIHQIMSAIRRKTITYYQHCNNNTHTHCLFCTLDFESIVSTFCLGISDDSMRVHITLISGQGRGSGWWLTGHVLHNTNDRPALVLSENNRHLETPSQIKIVYNSRVQGSTAWPIPGYIGTGEARFSTNRKTRNNHWTNKKWSINPS